MATSIAKANDDVGCVVLRLLLFCGGFGFSGGQNRQGKLKRLGKVHFDRRKMGFFSEKCR